MFNGICGGRGPQSWAGNDDSFANVFSNYGTAVDLADPGVDILSTYKNHDYESLSGTSQAAPNVAGAAVLYKLNHLEATPQDVKAALIALGTMPTTQCDIHIPNNPHGYFDATGDFDNIREPLIYVGNIPRP